MESIVDKGIEDYISNGQVDCEIFGRIKVKHLGQLDHSFQDVDVLTDLDPIFLDNHVERDHRGETIPFLIS